MSRSDLRPWTLDERTTDGIRLHTKRCCEACGQPLGDTTDAELDAAMSGAPLKGWRMPENTVSVARPSQYGNPFRMSRVECHLGGFCWEVRGPDLWGKEIVAEHLDSKHRAAEVAVSLFREHYFTHPASVGILRADLGGKNLACWCPLDAPCHADVLLELANGAAS